MSQSTPSSVSVRRTSAKTSLSFAIYFSGSLSWPIWFPAPYIRKAPKYGGLVTHTLWDADGSVLSTVSASPVKNVV